MRVPRWGRWCGMDVHWGVLSKRTVWEAGSVEVRWELRRRISSRRSGGSCGFDFGVVGVGFMSRFWRTVVKREDFEARVWEVLRAWMGGLVEGEVKCGGGV